MFADSMLIYSPETALKYGFIDGIKYYDEVLAELEKESGVTEKDKDDYIIGISNYSKAGLKKEKKK